MKTQLIAFTLTAFPGAAFAVPEYAPFAGECGSDADCGEGLVCEVTGASGCDCAAPSPDDPSGEREACSCDPVEYRSCVPGPCQTNADCGAGLVCATYEQPCASTALPCTPDGYCPEPEPCEATTISVCAPQWVLPCETAADCGAGFECEASEICSCSAGTNSTEPAQGGGSDGGAPQDALPETPREPEADCTCEPSGTNHCVAVEVACDDASACPAGWTCERMMYDTPCAIPEPADDGGAEFAPPDSEEKNPCAAEPAPPSQGVCYPPHSVDFDAGIPRGDDDASNPQYEAGTANGVPLAPESPEGTTPGQKDTGCGGGAASVGGLALLMAALWRRRLAA